MVAALCRAENWSYQWTSALHTFSLEKQGISNRMCWRIFQRNKIQQTETVTLRSHNLRGSRRLHSYRLHPCEGLHVSTYFQNILHLSLLFEKWLLPVVQDWTRILVWWVLIHTASCVSSFSTRCKSFAIWPSPSHSPDSFWEPVSLS